VLALLAYMYFQEPEGTANREMFARFFMATTAGLLARRMGGRAKVRGRFRGLHIQLFAGVAVFFVTALLFPASITLIPSQDAVTIETINESPLVGNAAEVTPQVTMTGTYAGHAPSVSMREKGSVRWSPPQSADIKENAKWSLMVRLPVAAGETKTFEVSVQKSAGNNNSLTEFRRLALTARAPVLKLERTQPEGLVVHFAGILENTPRDLHIRVYRRHPLTSDAVDLGWLHEEAGRFEGTFDLRSKNQFPTSAQFLFITHQGLPPSLVELDTHLGGSESLAQTVAIPEPSASIVSINGHPPGRGCSLKNARTFHLEGKVSSMFRGESLRVYASGYDRQGRAIGRWNSGETKISQDSWSVMLNVAPSAKIDFAMLLGPIEIAPGVETMAPNVRCEVL
jgi:hypothetical protein